MKYLTIIRERDQIRAIQERFFPYLVLLCQTRINDADTDQIYNAKAIQWLFLECKKQIDEKLQGKENTIKMEFTYPQALALNTMLQEVDFDKKEQWLEMVLLKLVQEIKLYLHGN